MHQVCHVVLVACDDSEKTWQDFRQVAAVARSYGVRVHVVKRHTLSQLRLLPLWFRPTLSLSPVGLQKRRLLPGRFLSGQRIGKVKEYTILEAAGVPLPRWTEIGPSTQLNPQEWGPYVVEKPSRGMKGAHVRIRRTTRVRYVPPSELPLGHPGRKGPMIAQRFIYTGEWPTSYRVVTFFGEVLLCYQQVTRTRGLPLQSRWDFKKDGGSISIVSNTKEMKITLVMDDAVMALARRSHVTAFPNVPLLQFDIVRDVDTGEHFVIECHPWEPSWPFSRRDSLSIQRDNGVDFDSQFDAMERVGRMVALKARELATRFPTRSLAKPPRPDQWNSASAS